MAMKQKCKSCNKIITGTIKIIIRRRKIGKKIMDMADYYDEKCFMLLDEKRSLDEHNNKKRFN